MILNLIFGLSGNIDNAAHTGGLITGLLLGYAYCPSLKNPESQGLSRRTIIFPAMVVVAILFRSYHMISNDRGIYYVQIKKFSSLETEAIRCLTDFKDLSKGKQRSDMEARGLQCWNENLTLLSEMDKLNLSPAIHERIQVMIRYCNLRIKDAEFIYKALDEDSASYNDQITECNQQITAIVQELKNTDE